VDKSKPEKNGNKLPIFWWDILNFARNFFERNTIGISQNPVWCSILELVRTHFSGKFPPREFGKAAPAYRSLGAGGEPHR